MSAEILNVTGNIITTRISGLLTYDEFAASQQKLGETIKQIGKVRFLVLIEQFQGTEKSPNWGDISFQMEYDDFIEKIAMVGDKKYEEMSLLFTGKGVRRVAIEYFTTAEMEKARAWLAV